MTYRELINKSLSKDFITAFAFSEFIKSCTCIVSHLINEIAHESFPAINISGKFQSGKPIIDNPEEYVTQDYIIKAIIDDTSIRNTELTMSLIKFINFLLEHEELDEDEECLNLWHFPTNIITIYNEFVTKEQEEK